MLAEQVFIFAWSIATGLVLGCLFDFFRAFRFKGIRDIWVYIQDIIFWLVTAMIIIVSAFLINNGELRGYMLVGYLLGAGFYMLVFSKMILGMLRFIFDGIRKGYFFFLDKLKSGLSLIKKEKKEEVRQDI